MQFPYLRNLGTLLTFGFLALTAHPAAAMSKISVTVRIVPIHTQTVAPKKKATIKKDTDIEKLEATLRNSSNVPAPSLSVHYYIIGRTDEEPKETILETDEKTQALGAGAVAINTSKTVTAVYIPSYTTKPKKGSSERAEHIRASGTRFSGWAVQVFDGPTLVAEAYSTPAFKALIAPPPVPATAARP